MRGDNAIPLHHGHKANSKDGNGTYCLLLLPVLPHIMTSTPSCSRRARVASGIHWGNTGAGARSSWRTRPSRRIIFLLPNPCGRGWRGAAQAALGVTTAPAFQFSAGHAHAPPRYGSRAERRSQSGVAASWPARIPWSGRRAIPGGLRGLQYACTKATHKNYKLGAKTDGIGWIVAHPLSYPNVFKTDLRSDTDS
jgi:hypothetical protein